MAKFGPHGARRGATDHGRAGKAKPLDPTKSPTGGFGGVRGVGGHDKSIPGAPHSPKKDLC